MKKVLIANRGEIAVRVIRACHDLGLQTVAVYSTADKESLHVLHADEAICIGEPASTNSYLKISSILSACEIAGVDAVHPGYGFLSENPKFASICESCGLNFIGPSHKSISLLGDKAQAKDTARKAKAPVIPGSAGVVETVEEALELGEKFSYPIFIKAIAGGGGKGIRIAHNPSEMKKFYTAARLEAEKSFGNSGVYLEKMIENPRHVEVQVAGDKYGNYVHLGERDCSIQRRRQKLIEEAPSPVVSDKLRKKMGDAAVAIVKKAKYHSVATVEFLLDEHGDFYFMEVNTRIQVEHTVTEELTGIDLVELQLRIARGEKLPFKQSDINLKGHVFQFRINAENPSLNFMPSPGKLEYFVAPGGPKVRVDTACYSGYSVPPYYDSMIAKLIVKGENRKDAINVAKRAIREFHIGGVETTIPFHNFMLQDKPFISGDFNLSYVDQLIEQQVTFS
ncbi:MAG: acetyl-CoA carboxylase biotin carboxylase subunit [Chlamydiales bacterium]|nr:acetyl-CoA carboxylase biotin carboxylase subunit [Chlamydiales bacterium]NCF71119.1 acetyl-CoA carboxylase biotin carboxylase subunit [Chlamydiales bacterium]